jgi:alkylhydroperoxidase/carboxymuconolactone decarboxylase family protein YurZ
MMENEKERQVAQAQRRSADHALKSMQIYIRRAVKAGATDEEIFNAAKDAIKEEMRA